MSSVRTVVFRWEVALAKKVQCAKMWLINPSFPTLSNVGSWDIEN